MKKLITFTLLLFAMTASSQEINKKTKDDTGKVTGLINICSRAGLQALPDTQHRYDLEYPAYQPDQATLSALQPLMKDKKITMVMGTWCGDSQLQVPHFYKILDALNIKEADITLICVDHSKKAENGLIDGMNISHVPTFIVTAAGKELGRITESPVETLEKDMLSIFAKK
ncbi:thioredoxin family protein [Pedobacter sp. PLR]|uniref:thioredoxin family protein n=1 Tax=Pedobacter sp. PLR TaxID=2994465 RepID=UPI002245C84C|nr:thioredoxin family protein [Pedobacter sp. PLR]MCX2452154.1 thioredoxin family protein [Pedobacter sp. PLR]